MARRYPHRPHLPHPSLFDTLSDFDERMDDGFTLIPDEEMARIAARHREELQQSNPISNMQGQAPRSGIFFMSIGSGSSGNCSYVGDGDTGFLIDAGSDAQVIRSALRANGVDWEGVKGIVVTHDHHDHIASAYALLRNSRGKRLYCTPRVLNGIMRRHSVSRRLKDFHEPIFKEHPFRIGDFELTPFDVAHDASDNSGFFITLNGHTLAVATDVGSITPRVDFYMRQADSIVLEANYDLRMLVTGRYPEHLKARILAPNGHLDNEDAARFLATIYTPRLRNIFLCHLSHDNNTPEIAVRAVTDALGAAGVTDIATSLTRTADETPALTVIPLPRFDATPLIRL